MKNARIFFCICFVFCLVQVSFSAVYTVTKITDVSDEVCDADCSLREAITAANSTPDNDTIYFALPLFSSPQTITLSGSDLSILNSGTLTINGTGANRLTISGNNASRIITVRSDATVSINHLRFTAGTGVGTFEKFRGGAIYRESGGGGVTTISNCVFNANTAAYGGALSNESGTMTIIDTVLTGNNSRDAGGAIQNRFGGILNLINTTVAGNSTGASATGGGGIESNGLVVRMDNVTISGNSTPAAGGGIFLGFGPLVMNNVTLAGNTAGGGSGGLHRLANGNAYIRNSILAGNTGGVSPDAGNSINSLGNNIIGAIGASTGWVGTDMQNQDPRLSPLGYHGGPGPSHALLNGSPAIDGGQNCVKDFSCGDINPWTAISNDERGALRQDTVDIGAFETAANYAATLPSAQAEQSYSMMLSPNTGSFTYSSAGGTLPPGISLATAAGAASVSGNSGIAGRYDFAAIIAGSSSSAIVNYQMYVLNDLSRVPLAGRAVDAAGNGLGKLSVILTDRNGGSRAALTNPFGYFNFEKVTAGETYSISVNSKKYLFAPQTVTIKDAIGNLNITAL